MRKLRRKSGRVKSRHSSLERLENRAMLAADWQNPARPSDVNNDMAVTPIDALAVINDLNRNGIRRLGDRPHQLARYLDTSGDGVVSPIDALRIINQLNRGVDLTTARVEGESETAPAGFISIIFARLPGDSSQIVELSSQINIVREEFNEIGLFIMDGPEGEVNGVLPTSPFYSQEVFSQAERRVLFSRRDIPRESNAVTMPAGSMVGVYVLQGASDNGTPEDHMQVQQTGTFRHRIGWEEHVNSSPWGGVGNRAYDDVLVDVQIGTPRSGDAEPVIAAISSQSVDELAEFVFDVQATDADLPNETLTFSLDQRPEGMEIDAVTGRITWTPQEAQGPGVYNVIVRATDSTGLFDLETFTISVAEVNPATTFTLSETTQFAVQQSVDIELGQAEGTRTISFRVEPTFDRTDQNSLFSDTLAVYVVDPAAPQTTLLDRGEQGTAIFTLGEDGADFVPGLVRFDGDLVTIDVTRLGTLTDGRLRFQLLNGDDDEGTSVRVTDFANVTNPNALARPAFADLPLGMTPSTTQVDPASYSVAQDIEVVASNIHFDSTSGTYQADLALMNTGDSLSRQVILALENLPQGVTVANASGMLDSSSPYLNFESAIPSGGLVGGTTSAPLRVILSNPSQSLISPVGTVLSAGPNVAPVIPDIGPISVVVGGVATINLPKQDPNGDRVTYTLDAVGDLPPGTLNGILEFLPGPDDVGQYAFDLVATDGVLETRRSIVLTVTEDTLTTTRVSGQVLDVDGTPLNGMEVELGTVRGLTNAQGRFTLDLGNGPLVSDTLKIRGETYPGPDVYPYIAEKLPLVLEREVFEGINNVIRRPIYLPKLDVANGMPIDPMQDTLVTTAAIPGASVMVRAGTLMNQQSTLFDGVMSITEVPAELTPAALPRNLRPDLVLTIQPGEMVFTTPAPLTFPNTAGYEIGTLLDLWSINPVTGEFDDVGDMRVVADANASGGSIIETISGGIRNSSWHFPTPPDPEPEPDDDGDEDNDCDECKASDGNFEVESHSGAVLDDHAFVSYQSMGQTQGFALHYDSQRADPRPIVHIGYSNLLPRDNQRLVASLSFMKDGFMFQVPGYEGDEYGGLQGGEHFWKLDVTGSGRVALQADFTEMESGLYTYEITSGPLQFNGEDFAGTLTTQTKELKVVNTIDSPFGAGWGLYGLIELVENRDGSVLWIDGGGSELYFAPPANPGEPHVAPPGNFSDLVKQADGSFIQTMPNQTVYSFNANNQIATKTDRNGNTWTYSYIDGIISEVEDPTGLSTIFTATNGRITSITDPANRTTLLEYDDEGNLTKITDPDNTFKQWAYDGGHRIVSETDKRGFTERVFYDYAGRATKSLRADGTELMYDPVQTQVLRPVEETTDPLNPPSVSQIQQIKSQFVDSNGNVTERRLDKQGQAVSGIDAEGALTAVGRNSDNLVTRSTNSRGSVTSYGYDINGNVTTIRDTISGSGARGVSNQGTEFWLAFMQNNRSSASKLLFISAQQGTSGNVSIPGLEFSEDFTVAPGEVTTIELPDTVATRNSDNVSQLGIHVTSELPISVSGLNQQQFTTDGFLGLPTPVVGREYLVVSSPNNGTHFAVAATVDATEVTIIPSVATAGRAANTPFTVTLNQGDVYYLQNTTNNADLTGSSISASAPVSVFSGHECGNVPSNFGACDHMVEQLTPVETWGTAFATAPLATRRNGDTFRILASTDDTDITINGALVATLMRGEFHETILTQPSAIIGTKPILTVQYSNGQDFDGVTADPFMQLIPPLEQYDSVYTVATPQTGFDNHFINVTIPTVAIENLTLNGATVDIALFASIAGTEFSAAQIPVEAGTHTLSSPVPFGMYIYGFGNFDSYGFLGGQTFTPGSQRTFSYDEVFNQLLLFTDDLGQVTTYELDPQTGNRSVERRVVGEIDTPENGETDDLVTQFTYTNFGLIDTMTDPLGRVTDYDYDVVGRLTSVTYAVGTLDEATMAYEYDDAGNQTAMVDGNGNRTEYEYDALNRLTKTIEADPDGDGPLASPTTTFIYDAAGNVESSTDANGRVSTSVFDDLNRLIESIGPDPDGDGPLPAPVTTYAYDPVGNLESLTDPNGNTTSYAYDGRNRRIETVDPDGGVTKFGYDADNNLSMVTDPVGNITQFRYDARSRLVEEVDPLGNSILYSYDAADNLVQKTDRNGRVTKYSYDDINRLVKEEWVGENDEIVNTIDYSYDAAGNLLSVADAFSALAYTYDARNRVKTVDNAGTPDAPNVILAYGYDDNSNVLTVADTIEGTAGATTTYQYDALDRLIVLGQSGNEVSDKRVNFTYNALGQYSAIDRYRDLAGTQLVIGTDYSYDGQNRLTRIDHQNSGGTSVAFYDYAYDVASRITQITDVDGVTNYEYDDRDQLISADNVDAAFADEFYQYDANGNRVESSLHGTGYETGPANRLLSDGTYNYDYDNEGNMIRRTEIATGNYREFEWDHRNRLFGVLEMTNEDEEVNASTYTYDSINRRISVSYEDGFVSSLETFVLDREDLLLEFVSGESLRYLHGPGIDRVLADSADWLLSNHLGSIETTVDSQGEVVGMTRFDSYGNATREGKLSRFAFTGRELDERTGLTYYRARWYSAEVGIFLSEDWLGFGAGTSAFYQYVSNNPAARIDPNGLQSTQPKYDPDAWNDGGDTQYSNNCYSYAANRPGPRTPYTKPQPGESSGERFKELTCPSIKAAAKRDGLVEPGPRKLDNQCSSGCPENYHQVQLVVAPNVDYHWYRQDEYCTWSHKPGWGPVTNVDASGVTVTNPSTDDRNYGDLNYSIDCGVLCAPN